jgi:hypothetical protein
MSQTGKTNFGILLLSTLFIVALLYFGKWGAVSQSQEVPSIIRTQKLEVVSPNGGVKISLSATNNGASAVFTGGNDINPTALTITTAVDGTQRVTLMNLKHHSILDFGISPDGNVGFSVSKDKKQLLLTPEKGVYKVKN